MKYTKSNLRSALESCMLRDQFLLRKRLGSRQVNLEKIQQAIERSSQKVELRLRKLPEVIYPKGLPVAERVEEIKSLIQSNQVVILSGETGSGKTTQIPKICLDMGLGVKGLIGHTQPRRIAARTVAKRIADELKTTVGETVGFKMRFSDHVSDSTYIKLMTDGILLAEIQSDRMLLQYEVIIIDEAHERSLNIDFILGYLKLILPKRPDLKIIVTSATIDTDKFSKHFDNAPVIEVSGRTYPVEILYRPLAEKEEESDLLSLISEAIFELNRIEMGDTLVFLPGEREIRETAEYLRKHHPPHTEILPLYSRLSVADQEKIFKSHAGSRVILATNVAETSLTVPGIKYVVDVGLARTSRYSIRSRIQRLPIEAISQAAANQRSGRCGRVSAGVCVRLYSEEDFLSRSEFTDPEILRVNLASVILQMLTLRIGDIFLFPFINKPERKHINDGLKLLEELGAVDQQHCVTDTGAALSKLPVDPRLGKMLVEANLENSLKQVLVMVAFLSIQDPRERPFEAQQKADEFHQRFSEKSSDYLAVYKLWEYIQEQSKHLSQNKFRKLCKKEFLSYMRIREWKDIVAQLKSGLSNLNIKISDEDAGYAAIHRPLLSGLLSNIGLKSDDGEFQGTRQKKFYIFPGSHLQKKPPKWIVASEIVETRRNFARMVAKIEPEWVINIASHLVKRHYFEPHWQKRTGQVGAFEKITLYGLTLVSKKRVNYGPISPVESKEIFIRRALVEGELKHIPDFLVHNLNLVEDVESLESKTRRPDILVSDEDMYQFYDRKLPADVYTEAAFRKWIKGKKKQEIEEFKFSHETLMRDKTLTVSVKEYPEFVLLHGFKFQLEYTFDPGGKNDGVAFIIPIKLLSKVEPWWFDWLIPGMISEKIVSLIKSLPKSIRKQFVPATQHAEAFLQNANIEQNLLDQLFDYLASKSITSINRGDFDLKKLPAYLMPKYILQSEDGKSLMQSDDIIKLVDKYGVESHALVVDSPLETSPVVEITSWSFGDMSDSKEVETEHGVFTVYPSLAIENEKLVLKNYNTLIEAHKNMPLGLLRLVKMSLPKEVSQLTKSLPDFGKISLLYNQIGQASELKNELTDYILKSVFLRDWRKIKNAEKFNAVLSDGVEVLFLEAEKICRYLKDTLQGLQQCKKLLRKINSPAYMETILDVNNHIGDLVSRHFLAQVPADLLKHYPRYMQAILRRLEKLAEAPLDDRKNMLEIHKYWTKYEKLSKTRFKSVVQMDDLAHLRWMIEEYRVSLYAQNLKTSFPISGKRIDKFLKQSSLSM